MMSHSPAAPLPLPSPPAQPVVVLALNLGEPLGLELCIKHEVPHLGQPLSPSCSLLHGELLREEEENETTV